MSIIKSISDSEDAILLGIMSLHNGGKAFELDPTFSVGSFYKGKVPAPELKYDIDPAIKGVKKASSEKLPFEDQSVGSIIFDPPFMFNPHGQAAKNAANRRFTMFKRYNDLVSMYQNSLTEFHRILRPKGIVAFKCQDYTDSKTTMTHCLVYQWAIDAGFYAKDLFIRYRNFGPAYNPALKQKHARKFHSYWFVFQKNKSLPRMDFG